MQDAYTQGYEAAKNAIITVLEGKNPETEKQVNCEPSAVLQDMLEDEATQALLNPTLLAR